jgi:uracil-DNA glycosylase family 4
MSTLFESRAFDELIDQVQNCRACESMEGCSRVLSWANGDPSATVMFIGEAPGRLGADRTAIPFHGDKAGDNFEKLLDLAGLGRNEIFVTNAVLCNPRGVDGNNIPPTRTNVKNCLAHLNKQIAIIDPKIVITLGGVALEATRLLESHEFTLGGDVRTANPWFGRLLIPLYHPGARAMIHRNFMLQTADYYFVGETFRRLSGRSRPVGKAPERKGWKLTSYLLSQMVECSLFRLHKALYLVDVEALKASGARATDFIYIRQKEGPYCVELGSRWFHRFASELSVKKSVGGLRLRWNPPPPLFQSSLQIESEVKQLADKVLDEIVKLTDSQLKTRVYLSAPMKAAIRAERRGQPALNRPLL